MTFTKLVWSTRAAIEYEKLVSYLLEEWGEKITLRASGDINRNVDRILHNPEQFPFLTEGKNIKKCVVLPYIIILFRIKMPSPFCRFLTQGKIPGKGKYNNPTLPSTSFSPVTSFHNPSFSTLRLPYLQSCWLVSPEFWHHLSI
jgi:plasmid stabilization system protein ParE